MQKTEDRTAGDVAAFAEQLEDYKRHIDARIATFTRSLESETSEQFGRYPYEAIRTLTSYLGRGGKRIRGALTMVGYRAYGGADEAMILDAALAIELLQAYVLMMDDIQDRSDTRRGGPTAHQMLKAYHEANHLKGDALHFGESIAMDAYMVGCHAALDIIAALPADPASVIKALRNIHRCYITTAHGQTVDIFNEVVETVDETAIENVLVWKTAFYTFMNPLQLGAILAGATDKQVASFHGYAIPAGRAFQITDDILGTFGEQFESGKSPLDDIQEGKRTILTLFALKHADPADGYFLEQCLGKHDVTMAEFQRCREIIEKSGALDHAKAEAERAVNEALAALDATGMQDETSRTFLRGLVHYLIGRKS